MNAAPIVTGKALAACLGDVSSRIVNANYSLG